MDWERFRLCGNGPYTIRDIYNLSEIVETHKTATEAVKALSQRQRTLYGIPLGEPYGIYWHIRNITGSSLGTPKYSDTRKITL